jgi:hypothetical protein
MLRCWKILVPLKLEAGYESVMSSLEKVLRAPVVIETGRRVLGTWLERSGADENCGRVDVNFCFSLLYDPRCNCVLEFFR